MSINIGTTSFYPSQIDRSYPGYSNLISQKPKKESQPSITKASQELLELVKIIDPKKDLKSLNQLFKVFVELAQTLEKNSQQILIEIKQIKKTLETKKISPAQRISLVYALKKELKILKNALVFQKKIQSLFREKLPEAIDGRIDVALIESEMNINDMEKIVSELTKPKT